MNKLESATNAASRTKQRENLVRGGVGNDIEILGFVPQQQITNAAANQAGVKASLLKPVQDLDGTATDMFPGDRVFGAGNDLGFRDRYTFFIVLLNRVLSAYTTTDSLPG